MGRWVAIIICVLLAGVAGYVLGHLRPSNQPTATQRVETRLEETKSEVSTLREQKQDLEERLEQVTKEQERLAHENEVLRKQQTTEQLLTGRGGELPAQPLK